MYHVRDQLIVASTRSAGTRGDTHESRIGESIIHTPLLDVAWVVVVSGIHEHGVGHGWLEDSLGWMGEETGHWVSAIFVDQSPFFPGIVGTQCL